MYGRKMQDKARMCGQPGLPLRALVHPEIIEHPMHRRDVRGNLPIAMLQKGYELPLPFARGGGGVDRARARIKPGTEVQGALADIRLFAPDGLPWLSGHSRGRARP